VITKTKYVACAAVALIVAPSAWFWRAAWRAHAQLVTLQVRNAPLTDVVRKIEHQTWEHIRVDNKLNGLISLDETRSSNVRIVKVEIINGEVVENTDEQKLLRFPPETTPLLLDYEDFHSRPPKVGQKRGFHGRPCGRPRCDAGLTLLNPRNNLIHQRDRPHESRGRGFFLEKWDSRELVAPIKTICETGSRHRKSARLAAGRRLHPPVSG
jgi:hypothetical protein